MTRQTDRRAYWSLHPAHVHGEQTAKVLIGLLVALSCGLLILPATGPYAGWLFALPVVAGFALWATASKWTRHGTYFHPSWVWGTAFVLFALLGLQYRWWVAAVCLVLACVVIALCAWAERWKRRWIEFG